MTADIRADAARYYDLNPGHPDDIPFYTEMIPFPDTAILELGCGTGRVLSALVEACGYIHGIDSSEAMLTICREKLEAAKISQSKAEVEFGDITNFDLRRKFDLITAPFRVLQNLETDAEVDGLFCCVRKHLGPDGTCILNVFNPNRDPESIRRDWSSKAENLAWEVNIDGDRILCYDRRARIDPEKLVLYPELIYRRYKGEDLKDETILKIAMRCYYPDEFENLVNSHGFQVVSRWGGYGGEIYGEGTELVIQFQCDK